MYPGGSPRQCHWQGGGGEGATGAVCPWAPSVRRAPKQCWTGSKRPSATFQYSLFMGLFSLYFWLKSKKNFRLMHNYLAWLLCSPLEGPVRHTFQSETTNRRWQLAGIYVLCACMHEKEPQDSFRACKISNFLGACPQTPFTQSILQGPTFVFALGPPILWAALVPGLT